MSASAWTDGLRRAVRGLARTPAATAIAVATLALPIGATCALFTVVNAVLWRPLPYREPARLVQVWGTDPHQVLNRHSPGDYLDLKRTARSFEAIAAYEEESLELGGTGEPERLRGAEVTSDFFQVLGAGAQAGQTFAPNENPGNGGRRAVISDGLWKRRFARNPAVLGSAIRVNGESVTVAGVLARSFDFPPGTELWMLAPRPVPMWPLALEGDPLQNRELMYFDVIARLARGASRKSAEAELTTIARTLQRQYPQTNRSRGLRLVPLQEQLVGDFRRPLAILLGAVALVWVVACVNIATLMLTRAARRDREMAVRSALGASRAHLVRLLLTESFVLAFAGGFAGLGLASWATPLLVRLAPADLPRLAEVSLDLRTLGVALLMSLVAALVFGLTPALSFRRRDPLSRLAAGARLAGGQHAFQVRAALIVSELAFSLVLLSAAGLLMNTFLRLTRVWPGFSPEGLAVIRLPLPLSRYPDARRQSRFYGELVQRLRASPEISDAATVFPVPLWGNSATANVSPQERGPSPDAPLAELVSASPGYFQTIGVALRSGRDFDGRDTAESPASAIVSASLAARIWPSTDPVGRRVRIGSGPAAETATIVGIAPDLRLRRLSEAPPAAIYLPSEQFVLPFLSVVVRARGDETRAFATIRREVAGLDAELPMEPPRAMARIAEDSIAQPRFRALLLAVFAAAALGLAALGVYGVVSGSVAARTREFGVRVALGAQPRDVRRLVLREGLRLGVTGACLGLVGALAVTRLLQSLLFQVDAADPLTLLAVCLLLGAVALLASTLPARRATRLDPVTALRSE